MNCLYNAQWLKTAQRSKPQTTLDSQHSCFTLQDLNSLLFIANSRKVGHDTSYLWVVGKPIGVTTRLRSKSACSLEDVRIISLLL